jgi:hypothetical protein
MEVSQNRAVVLAVSNRQAVQQKVI